MAKLVRYDDADGSGMVGYATPDRVWLAVHAPGRRFEVLVEVEDLPEVHPRWYDVVSHSRYYRSVTVVPLLSQARAYIDMQLHRSGEVAEPG
jgi:hypothetical protein